MRRMHRGWAVLLTAVSLGLQSQTGEQGRASFSSELNAEIIRLQIETVNRKDVLRYRMQKSDSHGTVVRDTIDTPDGTVARLLLREGKALTTKENAAERERLTSLLSSTSELRKKRKQEISGRTLTSELVRVMPQAMLFSLHPGQPQLLNQTEPQLVIDFTPNSNFHSGSTAQQALTGLQGTMWISSADHHLIRMQGDIIRNTNFAWGLVARVYPGGRLELEQAPYAPGKYAYSRLTMDLTVREMMIKTVKVDSSLSASGFRLLPPGTTLAEAVHILLDTPVSVSP